MFSLKNNDVIGRTHDDCLQHATDGGRGGAGGVGRRGSKGERGMGEVRARVRSTLKRFLSKEM